MLCMIALGAYALLVHTHDPRHADWSCDEFNAPAGTTCLDIDMYHEP